MPRTQTSIEPVARWKRVRTVSDSEEYCVVQKSKNPEHWYDWVVDVFKKPDAGTLAAREYEEARRSLLQHQTALEYHTNMVKFELQRIKRLHDILCPNGQ